MSDGKTLYYIIGAVLFVLFIIFRPTKPKQPSRLRMKEVRKPPSDASQIEGARWVAAENLTETLDIEPLEAQWVNPTIVWNGMTLDAYGVLGLIPGATLDQARIQAGELLRKATTPREKQKIQSALSAIEAALID